MIRYAPNVSWLFPELKFSERLKAVANAGFKAVEFGFPTHCDIPALEDARQTYGLEMVLFNQDVPVWDRENRGYLVDPRRRDEFYRRLDDALAIVERLKVKKVMLPAGVVVETMTKEEQRTCMIENLQYAANFAEQANVLFTIEVLNPMDNPGYFLTSTAEAVDIVCQVNHPLVRLQFDTYHIQLMEGNVAPKLNQAIGQVGHIQFADVPGRHEPGTGEIEFSSLIKTASDAGYEGYIGLEYKPLAEGVQALSWCLSQV